jgi:polyhydroxyalkanoate synthesis repressor PhaR
LKAITELLLNINAGTSMENPIELKKYTNRRLYDPEQKKFVTLSEVTEMIRHGKQVKVTDAKTLEDVTAFILTQILLEQAKNRHGLMPVSLLHLLIQYGDNTLSGFFEKYLHQIVQSYVNYQSSVDEQFLSWLNLGSGLTKSAQDNLKNLNPFQSFFERFSSMNTTDTEPPK